MTLIDVASHTSIIGRVSTKIFLGRVIPKTWQGGPKMILLHVERYISIIGRVLPEYSLAGWSQKLGRVVPK